MQTARVPKEYLGTTRAPIFHGVQLCKLFGQVSTAVNLSEHCGSEARRAVCLKANIVLPKANTVLSSLKNNLLVVEIMAGIWDLKGDIFNKFMSTRANINFHTVFTMLFLEMLQKFDLISVNSLGKMVNSANCCLIGHRSI
eukprot:Gb_38808 [translate_table: standard]